MLTGAIWISSRGHGPERLRRAHGRGNG